MVPAWSASRSTFSRSAASNRRSVRPRGIGSRSLLLGWLQDETVGSLSDEDIETDEYFDIHSKLLNALENDIGPANIKLRTGLGYVRSGALIVPGSPKGSVKPSNVVAFLQWDEGTVKATAVVIKRAHGIFDNYLEDTGS